MHSDLISPDSSLHGTHELCCETVASVSSFFVSSLSFSCPCSLALSRTLPRPLNPGISHSHSLACSPALVARACTLCLCSVKFDAGRAEGKIIRVTGQLANAFAWKLHQTRLDSVPQIRYAVQCMLASCNCVEEASLGS